MSIEFPSDAFPGMPGLRLEPPAEWRATVAPGALIALEEDRDGVFRANLLVTVTRHPGGVALAELMAAARGQAASFQEASVGEEFAFVTPTSDARGFDLAYVNPAAGSLLAVNVFILHRHQGVADLVHAVASIAADEAERLYPVVQASLKTLTVVSG